MFWIFLAILVKVAAKRTELGDEPDYYPKKDPNPKNIEELSANDTALYFDLFNRYYEITYKNSEHINKSYDVFTDNVKRCIILNKFTTVAKFGINEFAHLTINEFTEKYTGFNDTGIDNIKDVNIYNFNSTQGAPKILDWRSLGLPPLVRHQGPCKSSYVFSAVAHIEAQLFKNYKFNPRLSEQQAYDCEPTGTCKYGGMPHKVFEAIMNIGGIEEQNDYVYDPKDERECKVKPEHMTVKITNIHRIKPTYEMGLVALLALYGPIVTTMYVSESVKNYYRGVLWPSDCDKAPNHAVLLVGYGETADGIPYWIIKNSWGMLWGENGYIRLIQGEHACNIGQYVVTTTVKLTEKSNTTVQKPLIDVQKNESKPLNITITATTHTLVHNQSEFTDHIFGVKDPHVRSTDAQEKTTEICKHANKFNKPKAHDENETSKIMNKKPDTDLSADFDSHRLSGSTVLNMGNNRMARHKKYKNKAITLKSTKADKSKVNFDNRESGDDDATERKGRLKAQYLHDVKIAGEGSNSNSGLSDEITVSKEKKKKKHKKIRVKAISDEEEKEEKSSNDNVKPDSDISDDFSEDSDNNGLRVTKRLM